MPHRHSRRCGTDLQHHHSWPCRTTRNTSTSYPQPDAASAILAGFCLRARRMHRESARPAGGFWRGMPTPSLPPKRALAPPPRLHAKHASFCALYADRPDPAIAGAARQKRRFKNCANLCIILQLASSSFSHFDLEISILRVCVLPYIHYPFFLIRLGSSSPDKRY